MSPSDTTAPKITEELVLRCCGRLMYWNHTESKPACFECGRTDNWQHFVEDNWVQEELLQAAIDLEEHPQGMWSWVDDVFPVGTLINLAMDNELNHPLSGTYQIIFAADGKDGFFYRAIQIATTLVDNLPIYTIRLEPW